MKKKKIKMRPKLGSCLHWYTMPQNPGEGVIEFHKNISRIYFSFHFYSRIFGSILKGVHEGYPPSSTQCASKLVFLMKKKILSFFFPFFSSFYFLLLSNDNNEEKPWKVGRTNPHHMETIRKTIYLPD